MKLSMKALLAGGAIAVLSMVLGAGILWGALSNLSVPGSVDVTEADTTIVAYNDAACTSPMTAISFGTLVQGTDTAPKTIYVRNEGNVPVQIVLTGASGLLAGVTLLDDPQPAR